MLRETGRLARAAGWGSLGLVAIDGTKVRANTSRHKAMSHGRRVAEAARRGGVRLTRAGEAAPPAREAE